jgi:hypothetical protein
VLKFSNPLFSGRKNKNKRKSNNRTQEDIQIEKGGGVVTDKPPVGGVIQGSFYNNSKVNFFNKEMQNKIVLERIEEDPT